MCVCWKWSSSLSVTLAHGWTVYCYEGNLCRLVLGVITNEQQNWNTHILFPSNKHTSEYSYTHYYVLLHSCVPPNTSPSYESCTCTQINQYFRLGHLLRTELECHVFTSLNLLNELRVGWSEFFGRMWREPRKFPPKYVFVTFFAVLACNLPVLDGVNHSYLII